MLSFQDKIRPVATTTPLSFQAKVRPVQQPLGDVLPQTVKQKPSLLSRTARGLDIIFGGGKIGEAIGTQIAKFTPSGRRLKREAPELYGETFKATPAGEVAGSALRSGAMLFPYGKIAKGAQLGLKAAGLGRAAGITSKVGTGIVGGGAFDVSERMEKGETGKEVLRPGLGALIGGGLPVIGAGISAIRPTVAKTITKRVGTLTKLQDNNKPLNRVIVSADKSGLDTKKFLAESDLLVGAVDKNGNINAKLAVANLDEVLQPWESKVGDALEAEAKRVKLADIYKKGNAVIEDSGLVGKLKIQARNRLKQEMSALAGTIDEAGTIPLKLVHDLKVQTNRINAKSFIDPEKNIIGKTTARGFKEFIEESTEALDVKTFNAELRKLYSVRNVLEALDGKKVMGGRLGKYFSQTIGAMAGSSVGGPIGAVIGAEAGGMARGVQMSRALGGRGGKAIKPTQKMIQALQSQSSKPKSFLPRKIHQNINISKPNVISSKLSPFTPKSNATKKLAGFGKKDTFPTELSYLQKQARGVSYETFKRRVVSNIGSVERMEKIPDDVANSVFKRLQKTAQRGEFGDEAKLFRDIKGRNPKRLTGNQETTIYRASPVGNLRAGDFVTTDKGEAGFYLSKTKRIYTHKVKQSDLVTMEGSMGGGQELIYIPKGSKQAKAIEYFKNPKEFWEETNK